MGLFSRKKKIDYNAVFKEKYKSANKLSQQAHNEIDYVIKESLWQNVVDSYKELIDLIDQGADFDKKYFESLMENANKELDVVKKINNGDYGS